MLNTGCDITESLTAPCWGGCPWGGGWGTDGVEAETLLLVLTPGEELWEVLAGDAAVVANAPVLTGLCLPDVCLLCRLCTSPSFGLLKYKPNCAQWKAH